MRPGTRVSQVACALVATAVALGSAAAQPSAQGEPGAGVFLEQATGALDRVPSETLVDVRPSSMASAMLGRLSFRGVLAGATAATTVSAAPVFLFRFDPNAGRRQAPPADFESMARMLTPDMPHGATTAADFSLIRVTVEGDERHCRLGSGRGGGPDAVAIAVDKAGPNAYRVRPKAPLADGEYLFAFTKGGPGGMVFPFTVGGPGRQSPPSPADAHQERGR